MDTIKTLNVRVGLFSQDNIVASLGDDFHIFDIRNFHCVDWPFKVDAYGFFIGLHGASDAVIDLCPYHLAPNTMFVNLPGQLIKMRGMSHDFHAVGMMMSTEFVKTLGLPYSFQLNQYLKNNPLFTLSAPKREAMLAYYDMVRGLLGEPRRFQRETLRHLTCVFFYGLGSYLYQLPERQSRTSEEDLMQRFLDEVKAHFKRERQVQFYADRLCLTPKYLSTLIKKISGRGAAEWINGFVIEEACALLNGTPLTAQQISCELGFPSQSFFGKYFKRAVGLSPNEYREK